MQTKQPRLQALFLSDEHIDAHTRQAILRTHQLFALARDVSTSVLGAYSERATIAVFNALMDRDLVSEHSSDIAAELDAAPMH